MNRLAPNAKETAELDSAASSNVYSDPGGGRRGRF